MRKGIQLKALTWVYLIFFSAIFYQSRATGQRTEQDTCAWSVSGSDAKSGVHIRYAADVAIPAGLSKYLATPLFRDDIYRFSYPLGGASKSSHVTLRFAPSEKEPSDSDSPPFPLLCQQEYSVGEFTIFLPAFPYASQADHDRFVEQGRATLAYIFGLRLYVRQAYPRARVFPFDSSVIEALSPLNLASRHWENIHTNAQLASSSDAHAPLPRSYTNFQKQVLEITAHVFASFFMRVQLAALNLSRVSPPLAGKLISTQLALEELETKTDPTGNDGQLSIIAESLFDASIEFIHSTPDSSEFDKSAIAALNKTLAKKLLPSKKSSGRSSRKQ